MPKGNLPPDLRTALFAAAGGFVGAAVGVLAVGAMSDSDADAAALHKMEERPAMVAELHLPEA